MDDVSILVLSCDSYMDALEPFFILKDRYWTGCSYKTYVSTETVVPKYGISLRHNYPISMWTRRIRESLKEIDTKYVILMDSDFFIRNQVKQERIDYCLSQFDDNTITFSFELEYSPTLPSNKDGFRIKPNKSPYLNSCQPSIWNRNLLIERLSVDMDPWKWEKTVVDSKYIHYVNSDSIIIDIGYYRKGLGKRTYYGIRRGKWVEEDVVELFKKENINMDFSKRGFYGKT